MPRSDYATCFFFFQKTFVFRKPKHTPRNRRTASARLIITCFTIPQHIIL